MSKSVLISIQPKWCELIASGKKTIEVRKNRPKLDTPFKCYIYCTKSKPLIGNYEGHIYFMDEGDFDYYNKNTIFKCNSKVIGEFVCDTIFPISITYSDPDSRIALKEVPYTCLTDKQIMDYLGNGKTGYGWHISNLKIYDKPKELSKFIKCTYPFDCCACDFWDSTYLVCAKPIRPPQSWCYVEE